jgi:hypothetical protein
MCTYGLEFNRFIFRKAPPIVFSGYHRYSTSSAYHALFVGQSGIPCMSVLRKARAPPACKFFLWLALLDRCWTSERLQRHNLQNNGPCDLCSQETEMINHHLLQCSFSRDIWFAVPGVPSPSSIYSCCSPELVV